MAKNRRMSKKIVAGLTVAGLTAAVPAGLHFGPGIIDQVKARLAAGASDSAVVPPLAANGTLQPKAPLVEKTGDLAHDPVDKEAMALVQEAGESTVGSDVVLGALHMAGRLGRADYGEAARWVSSAAEAGNPYGLYLRMRMREDGLLPADNEAMLTDARRLTSLDDAVPALLGRTAALMTRLAARAKEFAQPAKTPAVAEVKVPENKPAGDTEKAPEVKTAPSSAEAAASTGEATARDGLANGLVSAIDKNAEPAAKPVEKSEAATIKAADEAKPAKVPGQFQSSQIDFSKPVADESAKGDGVETAPASKSAEGTASDNVKETVASPVKPAAQNTDKTDPAVKKPAAEKVAPDAANTTNVDAQRKAAAKKADEKAQADKAAADKAAVDKAAADEAAAGAARQAAADKATAERSAATKNMPAPAESGADTKAKPDQQAVTGNAPATNVPASDQDSRAEAAAGQLAAMAQQKKVPSQGVAPLGEDKKADQPQRQAIDAPASSSSLDAFKKSVAEAQQQLAGGDQGFGDSQQPEKPGSMVNSKGAVLAEIPQPKNPPSVSKLALNSGQDQASDQPAPQKQADGGDHSGNVVFVARSSDRALLLKTFNKFAQDYDDMMEGLKPEVTEQMASSGPTFVLGIYGFSSVNQRNAVCGLFGLKISKCVWQIPK